MLSPALAAISLVLLMTACDRSKPALPPAEPTANPTNAVAEATPPKSQFASLLGRWERPDGGYVLEFKSVDAAGKLDAHYFNPGSINVERAQAVVESDGTKIFVVLRDANYPGCIYKLTFDAKSDQLFGTYFQAAMGETYDVTFGRQKSDGR